MKILQPLLAHKYKILTTLFLATAAYYAYPIYAFYAHTHKVPMVPFGWVSVPETGAPATARLYDERYRTAADRVMQEMEQHRVQIGAPSFSVAVAVGGDFVWAGATGWANLERGIKATPDTVYRVGSTSKAITATALARLVDRGIMGLDVAIERYMRDLPNGSWRAITPRQLASHSSGLAHYGQRGVKSDYVGLYKVMALNTRYDRMKDALEIFDGTSLRSKPGVEFFYSSQGTVLLGAVMSAAAGKPYINLVQEEVLQPNRMTATRVSPVNGDAEKDFAVPYKRRQKSLDSKVRPWRAVDLSHRLPGGGFAATSSDLVLMGLAYFDESYISPETRKMFWMPQTLSNGKINPQNYAIGWRRHSWQSSDGGTIENVNHGGVSRGGQSMLMLIPEHEMVVAFNTNVRTPEFGDFGKIYKLIVEAFLADKREG